MKYKEIHADMQEDIQAVQEWSEELYNQHFGNYLQDVKELYANLKSKQRSITDEELEIVLTTLPLELITVSEILGQFKIGKEVVDLKVKSEEAQLFNTGTAPTITQRKEDAAFGVLEHKLVKTVYAGVIARVDREMEFARELIMSAKKIWDSRKSTESVVPVGPIASSDQDLPDYEYNASISTNRTYVK